MNRAGPGPVGWPRAVSDLPYGAAAEQLNPDPASVSVRERIDETFFKS